MTFAEVAEGVRSTIAAYTQALDDGQGHPGVGPDHRQPGQQHQHERRTEREAEPPACPNPRAHAEQGEAGHAQREQVGPVVRLERQPGLPS